MQRSYNAMPGTACVCVLGLLFCLWASLGGGPEICFTAGCALYSDFTVAGISMWFLGMAAFAVLAALALLGRAQAGYMMAWLGLLGDTCLLALMLVTAPCFNCLIVALFLLSVLLCFRRGARESSWNRQARPRQILVLVWAFFFLCNVGVVLKSQIPLYCLSDNEDEATVRVFFSPSCPACRQAVERLSGKIDTAFYPVAENDMDVARIARMGELLAQGASMHEAMTTANAEDMSSRKGMTGYGPISLQLKLLRNKAHLFMEAGPVIPFIEYRGLPSHLSQPQKTRPSAARTPAGTGGDPTIPVDTSISQACYGGSESCEETGGFTPRPGK
ncbi:MAG: hypothetical protein Q4F72_00070 [Desulfovibrionaceae bacterium]|nr:hypothetical protein [Desulfovibrionaceae bacterium]